MTAITELPSPGQADKDPCATGAVLPDQDLSVIPVKRSEVSRFIREYCWRKVRPGALFRLGVTDGERLVGVVIVGRPQAHVSRDPRCAEILRIAWAPSHRRAMGLLYQAVAETARMMGFRRLITYAEHGRTSPELEQAGWVQHGEVQIVRYPEAASAAAHRIAKRWAWELDTE